MSGLEIFGLIVVVLVVVGLVRAYRNADSVDCVILEKPVTEAPSNKVEPVAKVAPAPAKAVKKLPVKKVLTKKVVKRVVKKA